MNKLACPLQTLLYGTKNYQHPFEVHLRYPVLKIYKGSRNLGPYWRLLSLPHYRCKLVFLSKGMPSAALSSEIESGWIEKLACSKTFHLLPSQTEYPQIGRPKPTFGGYTRMASVSTFAGTLWIRLLAAEECRIPFCLHIPSLAGWSSCRKAPRPEASSLQPKP